MAVGACFVAALVGLPQTAEVLPAVLARLTEPALFWLDAHATSGAYTASLPNEDTPVRRELDAVLDHPMSGHIIAVDDARLFNGRAGYPTLQELQAEVGARGASLTVKDDIIWIVPP